MQPLLRQNCVACHNDKLTSGNLNLDGFLNAESIASNREGWERIIAKLQAREMPPKGVPRPPDEQIGALTKFVHSD